MGQMTPETARAIPSTGERTPFDAPVVVGVSAAPLAEQCDALDFAAAEANRRGSDLWLVNGTEQLVTLTALSPSSTVTERLQAGRETVQTASEYVADRLDPGREVATEVSEATSVEAMVGVSHVASLVVCGRRAVSAARRLHTGSTASRVCAQSYAPVAVVKPGLVMSGSGSVVVGVDGRGHSAVAIETALSEASMRGQKLIAVHAWQAPGPPEMTGYIPPDEEELAALRNQAEERLTQAVAGVGTVPAGVAVTQRVIRGPAADALVDVSRSADLLVVGRHAGHAVGSIGLGSVARHVLGHAECPVIVTPTR